MTAPAAGPARRPWWRRALRHAERCLAIIGALFLIYHGFFDTYCVATSSMAPALKGSDLGEADWVLAENLTYRFRGPRRWEVAMLRYPDGVIAAKRVAALPGEEIRIRDGKVCINGAEQTPPESLSYLNYLACACVGNGLAVQVRQGHYFVLGDDSNDSLDSRFERDLPLSRVRGRPLLRIWPPGRIGFVNP
jgi:signal peptidase I